MQGHFVNTRPKARNPPCSSPWHHCAPAQVWEQLVLSPLPDHSAELAGVAPIHPLEKDTGAWKAWRHRGRAARVTAGHGCPFCCAMLSSPLTWCSHCSFPLQHCSSSATCCHALGHQQHCRSQSRDSSCSWYWCQRLWREDPRCTKSVQ